jgi:hypothetical protein
MNNTFTLKIESVAGCRKSIHRVCHVVLTLNVTWIQPLFL